MRPKIFQIFTRLSFLLLFFVQPLHAREGKVSVGPCEGTTVEEEALAAVCSLVRRDVEELGYSVVGSRERADFNLQALVVKLGTAYTVSISKVMGEKTLRTAKLKALYLEEVDEIILRLVRSVLEEDSLLGVPRMSEVTEAEIGSDTKRRETIHRTLFGAGITTISDFSLDVLYGVSLGWGIDWPQFRMRVSGDFALTSARFDGFYSSVTAGANRYFDDGVSSPYFGAEFGFGWIKPQSGELLSSIQSATLVGLVMGFEAFRNHTTTGFIQAKVDTFMNFSGQNSPVSFSMQAGINY